VDQQIATNWLHRDSSNPKEKHEYTINCSQITAAKVPWRRISHRECGESHPFRHTFRKSFGRRHTLYFTDLLAFPRKGHPQEIIG
jgi:hypothetical protein